MNITLEDKKDKYYIVIMVVMMLLQLALMGYFGEQKSGFHEDELYTYFSSNRTAGLFAGDRQWLEQEQLRNEFVVLEGEECRFWLIKEVQSWDVHPPLYYYLFHAVCSLVPGEFTKWTGIGVNMIAYALSFFLLAMVVECTVSMDGYKRAVKRLSLEEEVMLHDKSRWGAMMTCFFWGFSSAVISGVMFIRMYQWLTVFVLLCLWLHLRAMKKWEMEPKTFYLPLGLTVFFGFLTQYYYIIFHIFLGAGFCLLLLKDKKIKQLLYYVLTCALGLGAAILYYPSSLAHIFRGYRGTEAVSEFSNVSNTWERLQFFYGLFDDYVMNGTLTFWLLLLCILGVTVSYRKRRKGEKERFFVSPVGLVLFAAMGYFFTISKTALLLGETSNRYQLPCYGIFIFLLLYGTWYLLKRILPAGANRKKLINVFAGILVAGLLLIDVLAIVNDKVFFLYEEEKEVMEFVKENQDQTVVVFYNEASEDHIWWLADELMEYERVYLASQGNPDPITDETITESDKVIVYVADHEDQESFLEGLIEGDESLSSYRVVAEKGLWTLYEVS